MTLVICLEFSSDGFHGEPRLHLVGFLYGSKIHFTYSLTLFFVKMVAKLLLTFLTLSYACHYPIISLTLYLLVSSAIPLQTVWTQIRPDKMSGLIWIQTVLQSDGILERIFRKS